MRVLASERTSPDEVFDIPWNSITHMVTTKSLDGSNHLDFTSTYQVKHGTRIFIPHKESSGFMEEFVVTGIRTRKTEAGYEHSYTCSWAPWVDLSTTLLDSYEFQSGAWFTTLDRAFSSPPDRKAPWAASDGDTGENVLLAEDGSFTASNTTMWDALMTFVANCGRVWIGSGVYLIPLAVGIDSHTSMGSSGAHSRNVMSVAVIDYERQPAAVVDVNGSAVASFERVISDQALSDSIAPMDKSGYPVPQTVSGTMSHYTATRASSNRQATASLRRGGANSTPLTHVPTKWVRSDVFDIDDGSTAIAGIKQWASGNVNQTTDANVTYCVGFTKDGFDSFMNPGMYIGTRVIIVDQGLSSVFGSGNTVVSSYVTGIAYDELRGTKTVTLGGFQDVTAPGLVRRQRLV